MLTVNPVTKPYLAASRGPVGSALHGAIGGESAVERINQYGFYELGQTLQQLLAVDEDADAAAAFFQLYQAQKAVKDLLKGKPIELGISRNRATELAAAIESLFQNHFQVKNDKGGTSFSMPEAGKKVPGWEWSSLRRAVNGFETVFREEMREAATYLVPARGIFDTAKLVDAADCTFPAAIIPHVPAKARDEWKGAGRCLAFGLLSASGFHVARAVEGMLEAYVVAFGITDTGKLRSWGDYVAALERVANNTPAPDEKTVSEIRQMKDDWRNPLMHPRVVLSEAEARMLFANGESLIIAMATEIDRIAGAGAQPRLALASTGTDA